MPAGTGMGGAKIGEAYVDVGANTSALQAGMLQAQRTFDKKAAAIESRAKKMASTLNAAWKTAAAGTALLTAGVGKAVDMYMEFEDTQVELQKKLGATKDVIQGLTSDLTDLSMRLPTTRQELTEIAAEAAKVGVSKENIVAYTKTMKMFEEATGMAADQAALFFGRINAIAQAPISTVENLGSALAYLLDNFPVAQAEKITQVMLKMGRTVIGAMESSQAELAGLATAISSISQRASRPATQLRRAFMEMGEKTAKYADMVKMSTNDLADAINDNAVDAFVDWIKRFKELYGESGMTVERIRQFTDVSQAAAKGILPFVSNVGLMEDALEAARREFTKNEALALKYEIALTRLSTQLEITRGNVATAAQAFGGIFAPAVRNLNENVLQPFTERLVYIMTQSEQTREAIRGMVLGFIKVGGAITAIGLLVKALSMLVSPVFQIMALAGLLWAAWELNFMNIKGYIHDTLIPAFQEWGKVAKNVTSKLGLDFKFEDLSANLSEAMKDAFPIKEDMAAATSTGIRAAVFTAVWTGTGSFYFGVIAATIGVNLAFNIFGDLKKKLNNWVVNNIRDMELWPGGPKVTPNFGELITEDTKESADELSKLDKQMMGIQSTINELKDSAGFFGDEPSSEEAVSRLQELVNKYANAPNMIDQEAINNLDNLIETIRETSDDLSENTKSLLKVAQKLISGSDIEPEKKQKGGGIGKFIPGYGGGDKIPALLERGEFVWNKEMVRDYGGMIKGLWEKHRQGGPVGMAEGGDTEDIPLGLKRSGTGNVQTYPGLQKFNNIIDKAVEKMKPYVENTEKLTNWAETLKQIGYDTIVGFDQMDTEIQDLINQQQELEDQYKGQTKVSQGLIERLKAQYAAIDPSNIDAVKRFTDQIKTVVSDQQSYIDNLEALGLSTGEAKEQFEALKSWIKQSDMSWESLVGSSDDASSGLDRLNDKLGLASGTLESWATSLMNSFSELASATGELSRAEQSRISGWTSAAQSALQGNWFQAAIDLFTGYMKGHIEELKARRRELEKKIDATHDMMIQGVQSVAGEIGNLASDYLGPFGGLVDDAAGSMDSFMKMTVAFTQGNTLDMVKAGFQGVLDITTGLISTFGSLIEDTKAHTALQERLEPLWDKIGEALSQLVWPLFAIVDWALDYLGIMQDMSDQASDIVEMNVPSGLKRNRLIYEASATGPRAPSSGGGPEVPTWAEQIIAPLKTYLKPILDNVKEAGGLFQIMKDWVISLAQRWGPVIVNKIPGIVDKIFLGINWLVEEIDWESIWNGIEAMASFFLNNFPGALNEFAAKFDELLEGVYKEGGFLDQLEAINDNLKTLAKIMGGGAKVLAGMAGGAAVGAAVGGGLPGAVIGGVIGAIGGAFFQEGGIAMGAMPAMVGEGGPEAIMPLDKLPQVMNLATASPGVGGSQAMELSVKVRNLFDGKILNQRMTKAEQETKYKTTGDGQGYSSHGRNTR